ncbi:hypothetical protein N44_04604 [Microcystis aeruginosa NIES-44]|uniref:Uncharacterized protein n=1 Tax=Microcystis aeruginosa NIES-44 TaxID=449439 RepID=A0A0A1W1V9_MICAE|nr:hypothetical protein N44_04604 [Microcystis aeruginosa NIES-44]
MILNINLKTKLAQKPYLSQHNIPIKLKNNFLKNQQLF